MKTVLMAGQYTITFGSVGTTKILLTNTGVSRASKHCMSVINQTRGITLYSQLDPEKQPPSSNPINDVSDDIFFNQDTTTMTNDMFTVIFDWPSGIQASAQSLPVVLASDQSSLSVNDSLISTNNSTTSTLGIGGVFTGTAQDVYNYAEARVSIISDRNSATDGLSIQQSSNGTNWDLTDTFTYSASSGSVYSFAVTARYFRIVYTNSGVAQTFFRLYTVFHKSRTKPSSQRPSDARTNEIDTEENSAFLMGFNGTTWDRVRTVGTGVLSVSENVTLPSVTVTNASALNADLIASTDVSAYREVSLQVTGTWVGTVQFQHSNDNSNFINGFAYNCGAQTYVASFTGNGLFRIPLQGKYLRVRVTSYTSGTVSGNAFGVAQDKSMIPPTSQAVTISSGTVTTVSSVTSVANSLSGQTSSVDIAAAAITATGNGATLTQGSYNAGILFINISAVSGTTPTCDFLLQESADGGTTWVDTYHFPRVTTTGTLQTPPTQFVGNRYRLSHVISGTTPSFTRSLTTQRHSGVVYEKIKSFYNRTIDPNTLNSTTSSFLIEGISSVQFVASMNAGAAVDPVFSLEGSDDNSNWYDLGTTITATLSTTKQAKVSGIVAKYVRVKVTTAGTSASLNYISIRGHE